MDLWWVNSNAWLLFETIEKHTKEFKWLTGISHDKGPGTGKRSLPLSVLVIISKPKKEKQDSILFSCLNTLFSPIRSENYFRLKVPVFLDLEREIKCFTRSFKELQLVITPRPLGLSASKFVRL